MEKPIQQAFQRDEACQRIAQVEGVDPVIATTIGAAIADGKAFRNGRQLFAWLGLVPRQHSSGDKQRLLGISKRGDPYLRMLLIHGACSLVYDVLPKQIREAVGSQISRKDWVPRKLALRWRIRTRGFFGLSSQRMSRTVGSPETSFFLRDCNDSMMV
jgi:transposase